MDGLDYRINLLIRSFPKAEMIESFCESEKLSAFGASTEYLLAMKLKAGRGKDLPDIKLLMDALGIDNVEQANDIYTKHFPAESLDPIEKQRLGDCLARARGRKGFGW